MIDTDKYEGHTEGPWQVNAGHDYIDIDAGSIRIASVEHVANAQLIADAPLLLDFIVWVKNTHPHYYHKLTKAYQGAMSEEE